MSLRSETGVEGDRFSYDSEQLSCKASELDMERSGFKQRRMNFLTELLARKWECEKPGHSVCLCTSDGQHHLVSEMGVATWVDALYEGRATTLQPPVDVLAPTVKRVHLSDGSSTLRIIPFVPSRRRTRLHILARSASFRERLESTVLFSSLPPSSGIPGIGYYSGKGIKWLGERSLDAMDDLIIFKRTLQYLIWLDEREKEVVRLSPTIQLAVGNNTEKKVFNILEDALEMSRICYPKSVNACAETLGWKLIDWMDSAAALSLTEGTATLFSQIHCCLSILHLAQDIRKDLCESELAEELLDALTRVPLTLQGKETVSVVISLLAKELAFAPYSSNHRWLGYHLSCIINRTVRVRPLTLVELGVIRDIALRRLIQNVENESMASRPWEIVLFLDCESQASWFANMVLAPQGLQGLLIALETVLWRAGLHDDDERAHLDDILRVLWMLCPRFADIIASAPGIVNLLLRAFKRSHSDDWFYSQCWVIRILRQLVGHRPQLLSALVRKRAPAAFTRFIRAPTPQGLTRNDKRFRKEAMDDARSLVDELGAFQL